MTGGAHYVVYAEVEKGAPWREVCSTQDEAYSKATLAQFREAGVKARRDVIYKRPARRGKMK